MARKGRLRFFFEHGAGGCLWAGDGQTREKLGYGPVDIGLYDQNGALKAQPSLSLSPKARRLIGSLNHEQSDYLNPDYPMDPSLWRQERCDRLNNKVDELLMLLMVELADSYDIVDRQERYAEDPDLDENLKDPRGFERE